MNSVVIGKCSQCGGSVRLDKGKRHPAACIKCGAIATTNSEVKTLKPMNEVPESTGNNLLNESV